MFLSEPLASHLLKDGELSAQPSDNRVGDIVSTVKTLAKLAARSDTIHEILFQSRHFNWFVAAVCPSDPVVSAGDDTE